MSKIKKILKLYLTHDYKESVQREFADWLTSPHEKEQKDDALFQEWNRIDLSVSRNHIRRSYETVVGRIHRQESKVRRYSLFSLFMRVAAVVVVALASVAIVKIIADSSPRAKWNEISTARGEYRVVELSDGSVIHLAPDSRLIYPDKFTDDVRRVYLSGEAYADIAKDEMHRFVISAEQVDVIVYGTQFNIRSYDSNSEVEVMLLEGAIDMQTKKLRQNRVVRMRPGDLFKLDKISGRLSCETVSTDLFDSNHRARNLTFVNARLGDIAVQLERMFNVRIIIDQATLADERYYSAFVNDESLDCILSTLEQSGKICYYWRNGEIHLVKK